MESITIGDLFDRVARGAGDREAFVFAGAGVRWSYRETLAQVQRVAKALIGLGIERGDHVAVWATSRPEWVALQLATAKIGAVLVPIDLALGADELAYVLEQSDATTLFVVERSRDVDLAARLASRCPELAGARPGHLASRRFPLLKRVALLDDRRLPGVLAWSDVLAASAGITDHMLRRRQDGVDPHDVVHLQYTAGATGRPKGVELTHHALVNAAHYANDCMRLTARDRVCVPAPFHHYLGSVLGTLAAVERGATMVVPSEHFDAETTLAAIAAERCTAVHGLPAMFGAELAQRRFHEFDLTSLRTGVVAGAACPGELMRQIVGRMHAREMTVAYGQTEAAAVITQTRAEDPLELRVSTVGRALPHVEVRVADRMTGRELPHGQEGELWCRGYPVMRGYHKLPDATATTIDRNRWLHTGDLAVMDEHGYCRITGRVDDLVRRGGEEVSLREVEEVLDANPKVRDAQVFGIPDVALGEELAAWVRLREGEVATGEELRDFCRSRIAAFKVPRYVRFVDEYPTTETGKVRKFKMRELLSDELRLSRAR